MQGDMPQIFLVKLGFATGDKAEPTSAGPANPIGPEVRNTYCFVRIDSDKTYVLPGKGTQSKDEKRASS